jgi:Ras-related GTP-binding protein C/D
MSPHETLFLESTNQVDIKLIANNSFVRFQTWDFGGDRQLFSEVNYGGKKLPIDQMYRNCSTVVYVIDAQEDDYMESLPRLAETISQMHEVNPRVSFEIFLHKVDGDIMSEEVKAERQQVST